MPDDFDDLSPDNDHRMTKEQLGKVMHMLQQQDIAYKRAPLGNWKQRLIPRVCKHLMVRCTHGDEINTRNGRRQVCLICGRALKGPLPEMCFFTGKSHHSYADEG